MPTKSMKSKLADLIEANPDCHFDIDNDCWYMMNNQGEEITNSNDFGYSTEWYGHSSNYGAAIAEAFIEVLNRKGFKISASAV